MSQIFELRYLLLVYVIIAGLDILTGSLKAKRLGDFKSKEMRDGFFKKVSNLAVIAVAICFDFIAYTHIAARAVTIAFIVYEGTSILENTDGLPAAVRSIFKKAQVLDEKLDTEPLLENLEEMEDKGK